MSNEFIKNNLRGINKGHRTTSQSKIYTYSYDTKYNLDIQVDTNKEGVSTCTTWVTDKDLIKKICIRKEDTSDLRKEMDTIVNKSFDIMQELYDKVNMWFGL